MNKSKLLNISLGLILLLPALSGHAGDLDDLKAISDQALTDIRTAVEEKESGPILDLLTDDAAVIATTGEVVKGYLSLRTALTGVFLLGGDYKVEIERTGINIIDDVGYERGIYTFVRPRVNKPAVRYTGRFLLIWEKPDKDWKIHRAIGLR